MDREGTLSSSGLPSVIKRVLFCENELLLISRIHSPAGERESGGSKNAREHFPDPGEK